MVTLVGLEVYAIVSKDPTRYTIELTEELQTDELAHLDVIGVALETLGPQRSKYKVRRELT
jgi:hypothetical protein